MTEFKTLGGLPQMNWSLSEYNLICYPHTDLNIFQHGTGNADFDYSGRLFEYTNSDFRTRYENNLSGLAKLPTLVVAECYPSGESATPAFLSSIENVRESGEGTRFQFSHLYKISSEEVFGCGHFDIEDSER